MVGENAADIERPVLPMLAVPQEIEHADELVGARQPSLLAGGQRTAQGIRCHPRVSESVPNLLRRLGRTGARSQYDRDKRHECGTVKWRTAYQAKIAHRFETSTLLNGYHPSAPRPLIANRTTGMDTSSTTATDSV